MAVSPKRTGNIRSTRRAGGVAPRAPVAGGTPPADPPRVVSEAALRSGIELAPGSSVSTA
jgi:hypothetical protein